jgi:hypothetical protein
MNGEAPCNCPEFGGPAKDGLSCREKFDEALALEFGDPAIFSRVHHITVICYNLQHPDAFSEDALEWMKSTLYYIIVDGLTPAELRAQVSKKYGGGVRVKRRTPSDSTLEKIKWSMTILDVNTDNGEAYIKDIEDWAESILNDLDKNV